MTPCICGHSYEEHENLSLTTGCRNCECVRYEETEEEETEEEKTARTEPAV